MRLRQLIAQILVGDLILQPLDVRFELFMNLSDLATQLFKNVLDDFKLTFVFLSILINEVAHFACLGFDEIFLPLKNLNLIDNLLLDAHNQASIDLQLFFEPIDRFFRFLNF